MPIPLRSSDGADTWTVHVWPSSDERICHVDGAYCQPHHPRTPASHRGLHRSVVMMFAIMVMMMMAAMMVMVVVVVVVVMVVVITMVVMMLRMRMIIM